MVYAISDLHGCYDRYVKMLDKIKFSNQDQLYVLGDVVDRGPDGIKILLDLCKRKNIIFLLGNHEYTALQVFKNLVVSNPEISMEKFSQMIKSWKLDGGDITLHAFLHLNCIEQHMILTFLGNAEYFKEITVRGNSFLLAHTVPEKELMSDLKSMRPEYFLWGEPDYELKYFEDKYIVTGHTPTDLINLNYKSKIYTESNHIALDCGVFFYGTLGCIRLDDMKTFYV